MLCNTPILAIKESNTEARDRSSSIRRKDCTAIIKACPNSIGLPGDGSMLLLHGCMLPDYGISQHVYRQTLLFLALAKNVGTSFAALSDTNVTLGVHF